MFKKCMLFVMLTLAVTIAACTPKMISADEDYRVYSAVLEQYYGENVQLFIIQNQTTLSPIDDVDADYLAYLQEQVPAITRELVDDLRERNLQGVPIDGTLAVSADYRFISPEEYQQFFAEATTDGWDAFYQAYPGAAGFIFFSRPGYNAAGDRALVYLGNPAGYLAGADWMFYLEKVNGEWRVAGQVMVWIS